MQNISCVVAAVRMRTVNAVSWLPGQGRDCC